MFLGTIPDESKWRKTQIKYITWVRRPSNAGCISISMMSHILVKLIMKYQILCHIHNNIICSNTFNEIFLHLPMFCVYVKIFVQKSQSQSCYKLSHFLFLFRKNCFFFFKKKVFRMTHFFVKSYDGISKE